MRVIVISLIFLLMVHGSCRDAVHVWTNRTSKTNTKNSRVTKPSMVTKHACIPLCLHFFWFPDLNQCGSSIFALGIHCFVLFCFSFFVLRLWLWDDGQTTKATKNPPADSFLATLRERHFITLSVELIRVPLLAQLSNRHPPTFRHCPCSQVKLSPCRQ